MIRQAKWLFLLLIFLCGYSDMMAIPTKIIIRAKARDAKFIGSSVGGAQVIVRDKITGSILDEGLIHGSTGNTRMIMMTPLERYSSLSDDFTAKYESTLDIDEPLIVRIEVYAPKNQRQAAIMASTELWIIPGKDILGDGIVLEIPGFIVDVLNPRTHQFASVKAGAALTIKANVVMMCGCTISKGGLWDSEEIEVTALIKRNGEQYKNVSLQWVEDNLFESGEVFAESGNYEVVVYAYHPISGNTGVDKVNFIHED